MFDRFETFATTIAKLNKSVQRIKSREVEALGLKGSHVMCLYNLGKESGGLSASRLCELCSEDKAGVSRALAYLTKNGFVVSDGESGKKTYRVLFHLTQKGKEAIEHINARVNAALERGGAGLTDEQRAGFYDALMRIADNLDKYILD